MSGASGEINKSSSTNSNSNSNSSSSSSSGSSSARSNSSSSGNGIEEHRGRSGSIITGSSCSIAACLKNFTEFEYLTEDIFCSRCCINGPCKKRLSISQSPKVLVLQLKRFDAILSKKITSKVTFPLQNLNIDEFMYSSETSSSGTAQVAGNAASSVFDLQAVVTHSGTLHNVSKQIAKSYYSYSMLIYYQYYHLHLSILFIRFYLPLGSLHSLHRQ